MLHRVTVKAQLRFFGIDRAGESVHIYTHGTTTHAPIFSFADGTTVLSNPVQVTRQGYINFAADPGTYDCVSAVDGAKMVATLAAPTSTAIQADGVSFTDTGLVVVKGTNVKAALTAIDVWTQSRPTHEAGTLAQMQAATRPDGSTWLVTDQYRNTPYKRVAGAWVQAGAGVAEGAKGLIQQALFTAPLSVVFAGSGSANKLDVPGATVSFTYDGRPVRFLWRFPFSKYSVVTANQALQFLLMDNSGAASGAQNGVVQYQGRTSAFPTNATDVLDISMSTPSLSAFVDGTPFVVGTTYTWKLQALAQTSAGTWSAAYAANTAFYGHFGCYED